MSVDPPIPPPLSPPFVLEDYTIEDSWEQWIADFEAWAIDPNNILTSTHNSNNKSILKESTILHYNDIPITVSTPTFPNHLPLLKHLQLEQEDGTQWLPRLVVLVQCISDDFYLSLGTAKMFMAAPLCARLDCCMFIVEYSDDFRLFSDEYIAIVCDEGGRLTQRLSMTKANNIPRIPDQWQRMTRVFESRLHISSPTTNDNDENICKADGRCKTKSPIIRLPLPPTTLTQTIRESRDKAKKDCTAQSLELRVDDQWGGGRLCAIIKLFINLMHLYRESGERISDLFLSMRMNDDPSVGAGDWSAKYRNKNDGDGTDCKDVNVVVIELVKTLNTLVLHNTANKAYLAQYFFSLFRYIRWHCSEHLPIPGYPLTPSHNTMSVFSRLLCCINHHIDNQKQQQQQEKGKAKIELCKHNRGPNRVLGVPPCSSPSFGGVLGMGVEMMGNEGEKDKSGGDWKAFQEAALREDMQAFIVLNPQECTAKDDKGEEEDSVGDAGLLGGFIDFICWYSPADFKCPCKTGKHKDKDDDDDPLQFLSPRMREPNNAWLQTWRQAVARCRDTKNNNRRPPSNNTRIQASLFTIEQTRVGEWMEAILIELLEAVAGIVDAENDAMSTANNGNDKPLIVDEEWLNSHYYRKLEEAELQHLLCPPNHIGHNQDQGEGAGGIIQPLATIVYRNTTISALNSNATKLHTGAQQLKSINALYNVAEDAPDVDCAAPKKAFSIKQLHYEHANGRDDSSFLILHEMARPRTDGGESLI